MTKIEAIAAEVGPVVRAAAQALVTHMQNGCHFWHCSCPPQAAADASDWDYFATSTSDGPAKIAALVDWVAMVAPLIEMLRMAADERDAYITHPLTDEKKRHYNTLIANERLVVMALLKTVGP